MELSQIYSLATNISGLSCPRCSSVKHNRFGHNLGIQRYRCKQCGRTFNETINTPLHGIHDKQKMQQYLATMHDHQSIRAAAKTVGISIPTAFCWRHRILASLSQQPQLPGTAAAGICEIKIPHSYKGCRNRPNIEMPATSTLFVSDTRGIPCLKLLRKKKKTAEITTLLDSALRPQTEIATEKTNLLTRAARQSSQRPIHNTYRKKSVIQQSINCAARLSIWMERFNGVATRYLQQYWDWYRAETNVSTYEQLTTECFGHRQLQHFRMITAKK